MDVKSFILSTPPAPVITRQKVTTATAKAPRVPVFTVEVNSGPDVVVKRATAKTVSYLCLIASQGQAYIKDSHGAILPLSIDGYKSFTIGMPSMFETGNAVWDMLPSGISGANQICKGCVSSKTWMTLAKECLVNVSLAVSLYEFNALVRYCANHQVDTATGFILKNQSLCKAIRDKIWTKAVRQGLNDPEGQAIKGLWKDIETVQILNNAFGPDVTKTAFDKMVENELVTSFKLINSKDSSNLFAKYDDGQVVMKDGGRLGGCNVYYINLDGVKIGTIYEPKRFLEYAIDTGVAAGFADNLSDWTSIWADTAEIQRNVYGEIREKYPKHPRELHDYLSFKSRIIINNLYGTEADFQTAIAGGAKLLEAKTSVAGGWVLMAPPNMASMFDEASQMGNCLATYIGRVIRGQCIVMYLRHDNAQDESCCDVEIVGNDIVQFKAHHEQAPSANARQALEAIAKKLQLNLVC